MIALVGPSCVGKTTIGLELSAATKVRIRRCGDQVRSEAQLLGVPIDELPDELHEMVDAETREWAVALQMGVVEGRYLDYVLATLVAPPRLVRLTATDDVRCERWRLRTGDRFSLDDLQKVDEADGALAGRIYAASSRLLPSFRIDTSSTSVSDCVGQIRALVEG